MAAGAGEAIVVRGHVFRDAARVALARPPRVEHADEPDERRRVLEAFVRDGRVDAIPAARSKRVVLLDLLAQDFEPGVRYGEREVNEIIARRHPDAAALRRYLVDEQLLDRDNGVYWRIGGTAA